MKNCNGCKYHLGETYIFWYLLIPGQTTLQCRYNEVMLEFDLIWIMHMFI